MDTVKDHHRYIPFLVAGAVVHLVFRYACIFLLTFKILLPQGPLRETLRGREIIRSKFRLMFWTPLRITIVILLFSLLVLGLIWFFITHTAID